MLFNNCVNHTISTLFIKAGVSRLLFIDVPFESQNRFILLSIGLYRNDFCAILQYKVNLTAAVGKHLSAFLVSYRNPSIPSGSATM